MVKHKLVNVVCLAVVLMLSGGLTLAMVACGGPAQDPLAPLPGSPTPPPSTEQPTSAATATSVQSTAKKTIAAEGEMPTSSPRPPATTDTVAPEPTATAKPQSAVADSSPSPTASETQEQPAAGQSPSAATDPATAKIAITVRVSTAQLRQGPSTVYEPGPLALRGEQAMASGQARNCNWLWVVLDEAREGWILSSLVEMDGDCSQLAQLPIPPTPRPTRRLLQQPTPTPTGGATTSPTADLLAQPTPSPTVTIIPLPTLPFQPPVPTTSSAG